LASSRSVGAQREERELTTQRVFSSGEKTQKVFPYFFFFSLFFFKTLNIFFSFFSLFFWGWDLTPCHVSVLFSFGRRRRALCIGGGRKTRALCRKETRRRRRTRDVDAESLSRGQFLLPSHVQPGVGGDEHQHEQKQKRLSRET